MVDQLLKLLGTGGLTALESKSTIGSEGAFKDAPNAAFPALPRALEGCLLFASGPFDGALVHNPSMHDHPCFCEEACSGAFGIHCGTKSGVKYIQKYVKKLNAKT